MSDFMKIHPMATEFFHVDGRTDGWMHRQKNQVNRRLSQFYEHGKNEFKNLEFRQWRKNESNICM